MISTKGRYALRVMIDLAEHQTEGYIPLKEIAQRQEISEKYLESIVKTLVKGQVLEGLRGKGGGYRLRKAPAQYKIGDILRLMLRHVDQHAQSVASFGRNHHMNRPAFPESQLYTYYTAWLI